MTTKKEEPRETVELEVDIPKVSSKAKSAKEPKAKKKEAPVKKKKKAGRIHIGSI